MNGVSKRYRSVGVIIFYIVVLWAKVACAQEFSIDQDRIISVLPKKYEAFGTEAEYINEIFVKTKTGESQWLDKIYFSSENARIDDVFGLDVDADGVQEIVLISSDEIRADPVEGNVGPYVDVKVYKSAGNKFEKSDRLTNIFSGGVDKVVDPTAGKWVYKFIYPYKTKKDIQQFVSSSIYKGFMFAGSAVYIMQTKTTIYPEPFVFDSKMYLIANDKINIIAMSGGWATFLYMSAKKGQIQAAAKLTDLKL